MLTIPTIMLGQTVRITTDPTHYHEGSGYGFQDAYTGTLTGIREYSLHLASVQGRFNDDEIEIPRVHLLDAEVVRWES